MADNVLIDNGTGTDFTAAAKQLADLSYAPKVFAVDAAGADAIGEVQETPTVYTLLGRLAALQAEAVSTNAKLTTIDTVLDNLLVSQLATETATEAVQAQAESTTPASVRLAQDEYETVAASQTAQTLGATGATGDYLAGLLVVPATTSPGAVTILDNATSITVFTGGASSVSNLVPFWIPLGIKSVSGAWKVTTGANVSVIAAGDFT